LARLARRKEDDETSRNAIDGDQFLPEATAKALDVFLVD
jgi:hypothetical protein